MKILLISDDFGEVNYFKAIYGKLSISIEVAANPKLIGGLLLSYNPDAIMVSSKSKKFNALQTISELKLKSKKIKFVALKTPSTPVDDTYSIADLILDSPPMTGQLLDCIQKLGGDREKLEAKLNVEMPSAADSGNEKMTISGSQESDVQIIKGGVAQSSDSEYVTGSVGASKDSTHVSGGSSSKDSIKIPGADQEYVKEMERRSTIIGETLSSEEKQRSLRYKTIIEKLEPLDSTQHLDSATIRKAQKEAKSLSNDNFEELNKQKRKFVEVMFTDDSESED